MECIISYGNIQHLSEIYLIIFFLSKNNIKCKNSLHELILNPHLVNESRYSKITYIILNFYSTMIYS